MLHDDEERIALQSVPVHHMPAGLSDYEGLYFPIDHSQASDLLGQVLTQIEAMNLNPKSESAAKAIFKQMVWRWFDGVMDNCATSSQGCIAPIKLARCLCDGVKTRCHRCSAPAPIKIFRFTRTPEQLEHEKNK